MTSDEQLIERIRTAMRAEVERLDPPAAVMRDLPAPRRLAISGGVVPALAVVVTVVVAVVAITSLHHGRGVSRPAVTPSRLQVLRERYAVLRRPQRPSDRPAALVRNGHIAPSLTRRVGSIRLPQLALVVDLYLVVNPRTDNPGLAAVSTGRTGVKFAGVLGPAGAPQDVAAGSGLVAGLVPDGVTRVRWEFSGITPNGHHSPGGTFVLGVHDNVAAAEDPVATPGELAAAIWYGRGGRVIARADGPAVAIDASDQEPVASLLSKHFGVFRSQANLASQTTGAALPLGLMLSLIRPNPYGLNIGQARFVPYPDTDGGGGRPIGLWVVPGRAAVVLLADALDVSTTAVLSGYGSPLTGRFRMATFYNGGSQMVVGLVPDGNRSVTAVMRNGSRVTARVIDNVYSIYLGPHPRELIVKDAAGRTVRIPFTGD